MILKDRLSKDYDLIEISHHGSSNANCQAFLEEIIPKDKVCTAIQLRSSSKRSRKALNNYLAFNNPDKYPGMLVFVSMAYTRTLKMNGRIRITLIVEVLLQRFKMIILTIILEECTKRLQMAK